MDHFLKLLLPVVVCGGLSVTGADAETQDEKFVQGLHSRRLFLLAERYCLQQLDSPGLAISQRGRFVEQLIHGYTLQALNSPPGQRDAVWKKGQDRADRFVEMHSSHPRAFLVRMQALLMALERARLTRQEVEVGVAGQLSQADVRGLVRLVVNGLDKLVIDLEREIPRRAAAESDLQALGSGELLSLQNHARYRLGRAYRERALCYRPGEADRDAALTQALEQLKLPLKVVSPEDSLYWMIQLEQVACYRLRGSLKSAAELVRQIEKSQPPDKIRRELYVETGRLYLSSDRAAAGWEWLERVAKDETRSPDLDQVRIEMCVALWRAAITANNKRESQKWRDLSVKLARLIEARHGPYWSHRASLLLVDTAYRSDSAAGVDVLELAARNLWRSGRHDEAVAAYDKAAQMAVQSKATEAAFRLSFTAALIEEKRKKYPLAIARYRQLAVAMQKHPKAHDSHYRAVMFAYNLARSAATQRSSVEQLVDEHLLNWPRASTADSVRWLKASLCESREAWGEALRVYQALLFTQPDAVVSAGKCWERRLDAIQMNSVEQSELVEAAWSYFARVVVDDQGRLPREWSAIARRAVIEAVRIRLRYFRDDDWATVQNWLGGALAGTPVPSAEWRSTAAALNVVVVAARPVQGVSVEELLGETRGCSRDDLLEMVRHIDHVMLSVERRLQTDLAHLQVAALERFKEHWEGLDSLARRQVSQIQARAWARSGQETQAIELYQRLVQKHHRDGELLEEYAQLLLDGTKRESWKRALGQWRIVKQKSRVGSARRLRATYALALTHYKLDDKQRAAQIIRITQATVDLESLGIAAKFAALLKRCE
ncbi:MAG: hypothetical protein CMJ75_07550 [Planctomycetaceae bacterium]|nr:hypothetical protein [Planctomycetaceae bacterium]